MKILNFKLLVLLFLAQLITCQNAMAGLIGPEGWKGNHINSFLNHELFPGNESQLLSLDFSGEWIYTAIARESGHTNDIDQAVTAGNGGLNSLLTFTTANSSNWGQWFTVNFDTHNLFFEDSNGPWNVGLDSFGTNNSQGFKLFLLLADTTLTHLAGNSNLSLMAGDVIVGFNDNHANKSDGDHDDLIIAMRAISVPAPITSVVFGMVTFGLMLSRRKSQK
jgi:hypothetical protein